MLLTSDVSLMTQRCINELYNFGYKDRQMFFVTDLIYGSVFRTISLISDIHLNIVVLSDFVRHSQELYLEQDIYLVLGAMSLSSFSHIVSFPSSHGSSSYPFYLFLYLRKI